MTTTRAPTFRFPALVLCLALLGVVGSCVLPAPTNEGNAGSLQITLRDATAKTLLPRTLLPPIDMAIAAYDISGVGPGGKTFSQSTSGSSILVSGLVFGDWAVAVNGRNAASTVIGQGSGTATVHSGEQTPLTITVGPLAGNGTLSLDVSWTATDVPTPSIDAALLPAAGSALPLSFVVDAAAGSATASASITAGYYTLSLQLRDNGVLVMGAVEVVRIVAGQATAGAFDFTEINRGTGDIGVTISPVMTDPIPVTMTGQAATIAPGASMTVTASVPADAGNVTLLWYVNGESKAVGSSTSPSFAVGAALAVGFYRLDVTAFTADGSRAGAATHRFTVQ